jgi:hypothetical protein
MGFDPARVKHIQMAGDSLGNYADRAIEKLAHRVPVRPRPFFVLPDSYYLIQKSS